MAKAFIYDNVDLLGATLADGVFQVNGGTLFSDTADPIANEGRAIDQSIGLAVGGWDTNEMLRIDLGASPGTPDRFAILFNAQETDDIIVYAGNSATDLTVSTEVLNLSATFQANVWTVSAFDTGPGNVRYYFIRAASGSLIGLVELIIGKIYSFERVLKAGGSIGDKFGVDILTTHNGIEYSNKRHNPKTVWRNQWGGLSASERTNLENFRADVGGPHKKFLYYDETSYYWVRMTEDSLIFTNEGGNLYSAPITLVKQLE